MNPIKESLAWPGQQAPGQQWLLLGSCLPTRSWQPYCSADAAALAQAASLPLSWAQALWVGCRWPGAVALHSEAQSPWSARLLSGWPNGLWGPAAHPPGLPWLLWALGRREEARLGLRAGKAGGRWLFIAGFAFVPFPAMLLFK